MTEYDQREELHAALGHKMMGSGVMGSASVSTTEGSRSLLDSPANHEKYHVAGMAAMKNHADAVREAGSWPTTQSCIDAAVEAMTALMVRDIVRRSVGEIVERYIDDATGAQVSEDWWPGDPLPHPAD